MRLISIVILCLLISAVKAQPSMSFELKEKVESQEGLKTKKDVDFNHPTVTINSIKHASLIGLCEPGFNQNELPKGVRIGSRIGNIITLKIPTNNLYLIKSIVGLKYVELAKPIAPQLKKLVVDLRADSAHVLQATNNFGFTGKDVLIGVTDWGFDYTHPMFYDTSLSYSRIHAAWDQFKQGGNKPQGFNYGAEYVTEQELMNAQSDTASTYYDYATHGSHVAGIAAGALPDLGLYGVAFDANLLFTQILLEAGGAIDAVAWMKQKADQAGKRLVINMSWGLYHLGNMDGTSLVGQAFKNLIDEGVVIVTSGGNNGDVDFHIRKTFNQDTIFTKVNFYNYNSHPNMWGQNLIMWGAHNNPFSAAVEVYSGNTLEASTPFYATAAGDIAVDTTITLGSDVIKIEGYIERANPLNNRPHIILGVQNKNPLKRIILRSTGVGTVHYWNVTNLDNGAGNWGMPFASFGVGATVGDNLYGIGVPASTPEVISVAAHNAQTALPNGTVLNGEIAYFSSIGPTLNEIRKPDVSAPGVGVVSSISSFTTRSYTPVLNYNFNGRSYDFAAFSGTSMSGPSVAGVAALLLEANPGLTPEEIKSILQNSAREDDKTGVLPNDVWGNGKVNAIGAIRQAVALGVKEPKTQELMVYPNPAKDRLYLNFLVAPSKLKVKILNQLGQVVQNYDSYDQTISALNIGNLPAGIYLVKVIYDGQIQHHKILHY